MSYDLIKCCKQDGSYCTLARILNNVTIGQRRSTRMVMPVCSIHDKGNGIYSYLAIHILEPHNIWLQINVTPSWGEKPLKKGCQCSEFFFSKWLINCSFMRNSWLYSVSEQFLYKSQKINFPKAYFHQFYPNSFKELKTPQAVHFFVSSPWGHWILVV